MAHGLAGTMAPPKATWGGWKRRFGRRAIVPGRATAGSSSSFHSIFCMRQVLFLLIPICRADLVPRESDGLRKCESLARGAWL